MAQWTYHPSIAPFLADKLDPAYLTQLQAQMHATGAEKGYLASWARTGLRIFEMPYSYGFMAAAAEVLSIVIPAYIAPDEAPALPQRFLDLSTEAQAAVTNLYVQLGAVVSSCKPVPMPGMASHLNMFNARAHMPANVCNLSAAGLTR